MFLKLNQNISLSDKLFEGMDDPWSEWKWHVLLSTVVVVRTRSFAASAEPIIRTYSNINHSNMFILYLLLLNTIDSDYLVNHTDLIINSGSGNQPRSFQFISDSCTLKQRNLYATSLAAASGVKPRATRWKCHASFCDFQTSVCSFAGEAGGSWWE